MGEHSPEFDNQPEPPKGRIDQHSSGNSVGGQQAAVGNENFQYQDNSSNTYNCNFYSYTELQDEDLGPLNLPGKILNYIGVFLALCLLLLSWAFFGLFIKFPFPYSQAIQLFLSCFRLKVGEKVNRLQKRLQLDMAALNSEMIESLSEAELLEKLNQLEFQARLYLNILKKIDSNHKSDHKRVAKTIAALKQQRRWLQSEIEPLQSSPYKFITKLHDFWDSGKLSQVEKDLEKVESILTQATASVRTSHPSKTILKNTIEVLSREIRRNSQNITPYQLSILYNIEILLNEMSDKDISKLEESELEKLNREVVNSLESQKENLRRALNTTLLEKESIQKELSKFSNEMLRLNNLVEQYEANSFQLQETISQYKSVNQEQQGKIYNFNKALKRNQESLANLQVQRDHLKGEVNRLRHVNQQKQVKVEDLNSQLGRYSNMRWLDGDYIGDLGRRNSYHYSRTCPFWKALVADYVLQIDPTRNIVSSPNPSCFIGKLSECDKCAGNRFN